MYRVPEVIPFGQCLLFWYSGWKETLNGWVVRFVLGPWKVLWQMSVTGLAELVKNESLVQMFMDFFLSLGMYHVLVLPFSEYVHFGNMNIIVVFVI